MTTGHAAAEAIKPIAQAAVPSWAVQFGLWLDSGEKGGRYVVLRPIGGSGSGLVRRPMLSAMFVGAVGDAAAVVTSAVDAFQRGVRSDVGPALVYAEVSEPVVMQTADGRPVAEVVVSSILSL
jgi:hypothetical protein